MPKTNESVLTEYKRELRDVRDCADNTVKAYSRELECLAEFLATHGRDLVTAKRDDFIDFKASLAARAPNGVAMAIKAIKSCYSWMDESGMLQPSPVPSGLKVKVKKQDPTDVPTARQFIEMRAKLEIIPTDPRAIPADVRRAIVEVLAGSGLRIEAFLTMKPTHVLFGTRPYIMVDASDMSVKGNHAGEIPLSPYAAQLLQKHVESHAVQPNHPCFDVSASMVRLIMNQIAPEGLDMKPHSLRHFYCSMTYYRNFDGGRTDAVWVRDAAGHGSIATTDNYLRMARRVCQSDAEWDAWALGKPAPGKKE